MVADNAVAASVWPGWTASVWPGWTASRVVHVDRSPGPRIADVWPKRTAGCFPCGPREFLHCGPRVLLSCGPRSAPQMKLFTRILKCSLT